MFHNNFIFLIFIHIYFITYTNNECILGTEVSKSSECLKETTNDEYWC